MLGYSAFEQCTTTGLCTLDEIIEPRRSNYKDGGYSYYDMHKQITLGIIIIIT
jgi:hypothetical protein